MKKVLSMFLVSVVLMLSAACSGGPKDSASVPAPLSTPEIKQAVESGRKTMVFFLNPEGGPCREQNGILEKVHQDKGGNFNIAYVSALKQSDQQAFYDYGIRNLPSLVLVDGTGKIVKNFPPGIQSYDTLSQALNETK